MFNNLFHLFKSNTRKTPLEDFTTELIAGVLNSEIELKEKFIKDFLNFENNNVVIKTRKYYPLSNDIDCIVDLVIESDNEICFIENKVNSREHSNQLKRYSAVLDKFVRDNYKTKLIFCTKNSEQKKDITNHSFTQIKWHNIIEFFDKNSDSYLVKEIIKFMKKHKMYFDMKIKPIDLITLENFNNVYERLTEHLRLIKPEFQNRFGEGIKDLTKNYDSYKQLKEHNRICLLKENVIEGGGYSEILYGVEFEGYLVSQIYVDKRNSFYKDFENIIMNYSGLNYKLYELGARIYLSKNLGHFINSDNVEIEIKEWFVHSFDKLESFMKETKDTLMWLY